MNKSLIVKELIQKIKDELIMTKASYDSTKNLVQKGDLKSDGKYDTRATEANYLADGQRQRISDLEQELIMLEEIPTRDLTSEEEVGIGSLVEISVNETQRKYFISPTAGGTLLSINKEVVMVISVFSPIGSEILGYKIGDSFEVEINGTIREYKIVSAV